jgi:hypothetical protein
MMEYEGIIKRGLAVFVYVITRVSNVLRNRADREYLEERRRWYFSDRMANARDWNEDSERYSV